MSSLKNRVSIFLLWVLCFEAGPAWAIGADALSRTADGQETRASEYVMRRYPGEKLMPVRILGGVQKPGTYYLPENTDLITAISLSGGLAPNADSESIRWNQWSTRKYQKLDLTEAISHPQEQNPALGANDVLLVEEKSQIISNNTLLILTALSSVVGITVGAIFISRGR